MVQASVISNANGTLFFKISKCLTVKVKIYTSHAETSFSLTKGRIANEELHP